jgi:uncharacterized membrane protein YphA (DoxX/SURF4 family)
MLSESWTLLGARIVGAVFLAASLMKVAAPLGFYRHVNKLGLLPLKPERAVVPIAIGLEAGWGVALFLGVWPHAVLPFTALGLVLFTGLTWWSVISGKVEDCGCYGGFITPSIWQSVSLNALYLALIGIGWAMLPAPASDPMWKFAVVIEAIVVIGGTAEFALRYEMKRGTALFTPSPLRVGHRWKAKWGGRENSQGKRDQLVSYLGPNCPYCKRWVRVLNVIHASPDLPSVTAVLASSPGEIEAFVEETGVRFPIATISGGMMQRLTSSVPTTVLVENGAVRDVWGGLMSDEFVERFKRAFFPAAPQEQLPLGPDQHSPADGPPMAQHPQVVCLPGGGGH